MSGEADIAAWLRGLGLSQYEQAFRYHAVDIDLLPKLTGGDLRELGVAAVGHRRKLLEAMRRCARAHRLPEQTLVEPRLFQAARRDWRRHRLSAASSR